MRYRIKITYNTGDSFNEVQDQVGYCGLTWSTHETASNNLARVKEHHKYVVDGVEHYLNHLVTNKEYKKLRRKCAKCDWYNPTSTEHSLFLYDDDGAKFQQSAFWHGYFETLTCAEVVADSD